MLSDTSDCSLASAPPPTGVCRCIRRPCPCPPTPTPPHPAATFSLAGGGSGGDGPIMRDVATRDASRSCSLPAPPPLLLSAARALELRSRSRDGDPNACGPEEGPGYPSLVLLPPGAARCSGEGSSTREPSWRRRRRCSVCQEATKASISSWTPPPASQTPSVPPTKPAGAEFPLAPGERLSPSAPPARVRGAKDGNDSTCPPAPTWPWRSVGNSVSLDTGTSAECARRGGSSTPAEVRRDSRPAGAAGGTGDLPAPPRAPVTPAPPSAFRPAIDPCLPPRTRAARLISSAPISTPAP